MAKHDPLDLAHCSFCGIAEDIHLLDGVLKDEQDTGKIGCIKCYPNDSWAPTGIEHIQISIAPPLAPLYAAWLVKEMERLDRVKVALAQQKITAATVAANLNDAIENGYDVSTWTVEEIATDLICYAADCECATVELLTQFVQTWLFETRIKILRVHGFIVGTRDPRLNTNFPGSQMVVEAHEESELPTKDGRHGPWCVVGDDLVPLVEEAFDYHQSGRL